jgi:hypothetical protein
MADTLGSLIDKLFTIDMKMWNNQELLYDIRRMTFDQFKEQYFTNPEGAQKLWDGLKKACDLNVQRNQLIDEIDEKVVEIVQASKLDDEDQMDKFVQRKHKTY